MAISEEIWSKAKLLFEHGKSLTEISNTTAINRSTISKKSKAENWTKFDKKSTLVLREVDTILQQEEINHEKSTLNQQQLNFHNKEVYKAINKANILNMFDNATASNQMLFNQAHKEILEDIQNENNKVTAIDHLPNLLAISKGTESNRKQLYGVTDTYKPDTKQDEKKKRIGMGDLYKAIESE